MKRIPDSGLIGPIALREAASTELTQIIALVRASLQAYYDARKKPNESYPWFDVEAMYPERAIVCKDGRYWQFGYALSADNQVTLQEPLEVIEQFQPVSMRESIEAGAWFLEAKDEGKVWDVIIVRSGASENGTFYPDAVLREAVAKFEGAKVYVKSNDLHIQGGRPDIEKLAGWISGVKFVEGKSADTGFLAGQLNLSGKSELRETLADAWKRGKRDLVGLSIDALGAAKKATAPFREGVKRIAQSITKVLSVDLIVDPAAGGGLVRLVESAASIQESSEMSLKEAMQAKIKAKFPEVDVATLTDEQLQSRYVEACAAPAAVSAITREEYEQGLRLVEARAEARVKIQTSGLPKPAQERLVERFNKLSRFTEAEVDTEIKAERDYIVRMAESVGGDSGKVKMALGVGDIQVEDRSVKIADMLDAFFDPAHKDHRSVNSFKECYIEVTGDKRVTGRWDKVDRARMAESLGAEFRESLDSTSFSNALGTSITRRMVAEFRAAVEYDAWRKICSVVPVQDFRTQTRVNIGGYGDLPTVTQGSAYLALTSPTDAAATYTPTKRGGTEDVTLEMIKNDDVGAIRRIPVKLGRAAKRTLAKFVFDFIRTNPTLYDSVAFFHATHGNLGSTALAAAEVGVVRTAMMKQAERDSSDRLGVGPAGILVPVDLQETAWNIFQRNTNLDKTLIQSLVLEIIPVWYWTDTNDWAAYANPLDIPGIEVGFLDGQEEPELFVQDMPNVGSLFTNDKVTYKIRHIYGGAVVPDGYKAFYKEVV